MGNREENEYLEHLEDLELAMEAAMIKEWNMQQEEAEMKKEDEQEIFIITCYGSWGSEPHASATSLEAAKEKALKASKEDPTNEYCIELDPGSPSNPLYKNGQQIGG